MTPPKGPAAELLPPSAPTPVVTADDVAALSECFYDLFSDVRPLGARDLEYFRNLLTDFSATVDIGNELKRFQAWSLDKGATANPYPRSRFRDWLSRTRQYKHYTGK